MTVEPVLDISKLNIFFHLPDKTFHAVKDVSLSITPRETLTVIGESGSGKSAIANAVMGLLDPRRSVIRSERLHFLGRDLSQLGDRERREIYGNKLSIVFQDPLAYLNPVYPIGWQVSEICRIHGVGRGEAKRRALALLDRVGIPEPAKRYDDYPFQFSGGQRQRIMIAMAIAMDPVLLIADESTTALDVTVQAQVLDLLQELRSERGMSLLMITHDLGVAARMSDRIVVLKKGEVVETGTVQQIFASPQHAFTRELLERRSATVVASNSKPAEKIVEVKDVSIRYGAHLAVRNASLHVAAGETLAVIGESGSGKSTIARSILKLKPVDSGAVLFRGKDIWKLSPAEQRDYQQAVQVVFQDPFSSLNPRMNALQILTEPFVINPGVLPRDQWRRRAIELLEMVSLRESDLMKRPREFSGGQCQRLAIARALALNPQLIVCDEAVSALDMIVRDRIVELLLKLKADLSISLLFIAHDLSLVRDLADRVAIMKGGEIVECGETRAIFDNPQIAYTKALLAASELFSNARPAPLADSAVG